MEYHPYPRSLYMDGNPNAEHIIVRDEDEEADARDLGFITIQERLRREAGEVEEPAQKPKRKYTRRTP